MENPPDTPPPADEPANVTPIPVAFKRPPGEDQPILKVVDGYDSRNGCNHSNYWDGSRIRHVQYRFRQGETEVECGHCSTKLEPMWVLRQLAGRESEYNRRREIAQSEMQRLGGRSRTKCENCGHMTRISRTKPKGRTE